MIPILVNKAFVCCCLVLIIFESNISYNIYIAISLLSVSNLM